MAGGQMRKHSVSIRGHRTSITLEDAFMDALRQMADTRGMAVAALIAEIDSAHSAPEPRAQSWSICPRQSALPCSAGRWLDASPLPRIREFQETLPLFTALPTPRLKKISGRSAVGRNQAADRIIDTGKIFKLKIAHIQWRNVISNCRRRISGWSRQRLSCSTALGDCDDPCWRAASSAAF